jgi:hypothetical protein
MMEGKLNNKIIPIISATVIIIIIIFLLLNRLFRFIYEVEITDKELLTCEIYHKKFKGKIYITKKSAGLFGSHDNYMISSYKKYNFDTYFIKSTDYIFVGDGSLPCYFFSDSSIIFFVGKISKIPRNFNSNIKIDQIKIKSNLELYYNLNL